MQFRKLRKKAKKKRKLFDAIDTKKAAGRFAGGFFAFLSALGCAYIRVTATISIVRTAAPSPA